MLLWNQESFFFLPTETFNVMLKKMFPVLNSNDVNFGQEHDMTGPDNGTIR